MPRGDRTGPEGLGPKTGRGLGPGGTGIDEMPENTNEDTNNEGFFRRLGRGLGLGRAGQGRGMGRGQGRGRNR